MKLYLFILSLFLFATSIYSDQINNKVIVAKGDYNYPPFEYLDKNKIPTGFNVDIIKAISEEMKLNINLKLEKWEKIRKQLENGEIDLLIGMYSTKERAKFVDFSTPHFITSYNIFVKKGSKIKNLKNLKGKKVGVQKGDFGDDFLKKLNIKIKIISKETIKGAILALKDGKVDAILIPKLQGVMILKTLNIDNIKSVGESVAQKDYCFAVKKGDKKLLGILNEGLTIIKNSGKYDIIYKKWFGIAESFYKKNQMKVDILKYIYIILIPTLIFIILIFLWNWSLKKSVKLKTKELQDSENNLKTTLNSIGDGVIVTDLDKKIAKMNPIAQNLTGYTLNEAKGVEIDKIFNIVKSNSDKKVINPINKVLETKKIVNLSNNVVLIDKNGIRRDISDSAAPIIDKNGDLLGAILVFRDVTEEYKLQKKLREKTKMDSIGQLAGGIAHDFNNILTGILNSAQILKDSEKISKNEKELIETILLLSSKASNLTSKLLAFGRKSKFLSKPFNIDSVLEDSLTILKRTINKNIDIYFRKSGDKNIVLGDETTIQNSILNIAINGTHAMPKGGNLSITRENITIDKFFFNNTSFDIDSGEYIKISIEDTGIGIDEKYKNKIFEPFFTTRKEGKGSGLGLASVYGTMVEHNGAVDFVSKKNMGTTFYIYLPISHKKIEKNINNGVIKSLKRGTILLIDDEITILNTTKMVLKKLGYKVLTANSGLEGLDIFKKQYKEIDCIILDMIMPDMDGKTTAKKLLEIDNSCKIVISSGYTKDNDLGSFKNSDDINIVGFLKKPYKISEIDSILQNVL